MVEKLTYLLLILAWGLPIIAIEWAIGWRSLIEELRPLAITVVMATVYLGFVGVVAMRNGIWDIDPARTLSIRGGGFVPEVWIFFLVTNIIIAQAVILALDDDIRARLGGGVRRLWP